MKILLLLYVYFLSVLCNLSSQNRQYLKLRNHALSSSNTVKNTDLDRSTDCSVVIGNEQPFCIFLNVQEERKEGGEKKGGNVHSKK